MHEFSIVESLVAQVADLAKENRMDGVAAVEVEAGELRQIIPEIMEFAFAQSTAGTPLEAAILTVRSVEAKALCRDCGQSYRPEIQDFACPACGRAMAEILQGDQIILKSITARKSASQEATK